jgi:hypothetical protein
MPTQEVSSSTWKKTRFWATNPLPGLLLFKLVYFGLLISALLLFPTGQNSNLFHSKRQAWTLDGHLTFESHFTAWDSEHYLHISERGYQANDGICAFYPLWPMAVRYFSPCVGGSCVLGGVILANLVSLAAFYLFFRLVEKRQGLTTAWLALSFLLLFPGSLFYQFNYTEALFFLLMMLVCRGLEERHLRLAWCAAFLLPMTRGIGVFCILPLLLYVFMNGGQLRRLRPSMAAWLAAEPPTAFNSNEHRHRAPPTLYLLPFAPLLGWLLYLALMAYWTGNPFEGFAAQKSWGVQSVGNLFDLPKFVMGFLTPTNWHEFSGSTLDRCLFALCLWTFPWLWKHDKVWLIWAFVLAVVPAVSGTFVSYTRFASVAFPVFIALGTVFTAPKFRLPRYALIIIFLILHLVLLWRFVNYSWAG